MLPHWTIEDLRAMKGYSTFSNSSITRVSPSDCFVSYPGHSWGESYPTAGMQSVYSTAPADLAHWVK